MFIETAFAIPKSVMEVSFNGITECLGNEG